MDPKLKILPADFLERAKKIFPPGQFTAILKSYSEPKTTCFRINTIKTTEPQVVHFLTKHNIAFEKDPRIPLCYYIKKISQKKIHDLSLYQNGEIYLQNPSSQLPALVLDPRPGECILDLCASPGSKTTQIAAMMNNTGSIVALEPDPIRFERLTHNVDLMGCQIVECIPTRAETFCRDQTEKNPPQLFDKVLVDAPCSGDGTFYIHDKKSFAGWSVKFVQQMAKQQNKILKAALLLTKPGGVVVYSTCSTSPEENEEVIHEALTNNPRLMVQKNSLFYFEKPLSLWNQKNFHPLVSKTGRIFPSSRGEGFFIAYLLV